MREVPAFDLVDQLLEGGWGGRLLGLDRVHWIDYLVGNYINAHERGEGGKGKEEFII